MEGTPVAPGGHIRERGTGRGVIASERNPGGKRCTAAVCPPINAAKSQAVIFCYSDAQANEELEAEHRDRKHALWKAREAWERLVSQPEKLTKKQREKLRRSLGMDHVPAAKEIAMLTRYPLDLRLMPLNSLGWRRVPVLYASDYTGPRCAHIFQSFLPVDALGSMPSLDFETALPRSLEDLEFGFDSNFTCYLGEDWRCREIFLRARKRPGYQYAGRKHISIAEIILKFIYGLEEAFLEVHPATPCSMVADFWRAYQVRRFVAEFCRNLGNSEVASALVENAADLRHEIVNAKNKVLIELDAKDQVKRAQFELFRKLNEFAELENHRPTSSAATLASAQPALKVARHNIAENIRALRKNFGWTQEVLVEKAGKFQRGLARETVARAESIKSPTPSPTTLSAVCYAFNGELNGLHIQPGDLEAAPDSVRDRLKQITKKSQE